jgi:hypothetical protein
MSRNSIIRGAAAGVLLITLATVTGCGGGKATVEGTVTTDAGKIETGAVTFVPAEGGDKATKVSGRIFDGKYEITDSQGLTAGKYKVEINWNKKTGKKIPNDGGLIDETKEGLPPKYNTQTELTAEVKSGSNMINFDLKGVPAGPPGAGDPAGPSKVGKN